MSESGRAKRASLPKEPRRLEVRFLDINIILN